MKIIRDKMIQHHHLLFLKNPEKNKKTNLNKIQKLKMEDKNAIRFFSYLSRLSSLIC